MKVIVFSTPDCANCKPLKASLTAAGVEFEEVNCHESASFIMMRMYGVRSVPTTIVSNGEVVYTIIGNKPKDILEVLK